MIQITLITLGTLKEDYLRTGVSEYLRRLSTYAQVNEINLPEERIANENDPAAITRALEREGEAILSRIPRGAVTVALCVEGKELSSEEHVYAGVTHPALGELVMSEAYYRRILRYLQKERLLGEEIFLEVPARELSRAIGPHKANKLRLYQDTGTRILQFRGVPEAQEMRAYRKSSEHPQSGGS